MKLHAGHIEVAVAMLFNYRIYTIVPNVYFGLGFRHECDMLALDKQGRFTEIEIKVTASDLKADFKKEHGHKSKIISRLFYAMPIELCEKYQDLVPKHCGIIAIRQKTLYKWEGASRGTDSPNAKFVEHQGWKAEFYRQAKHDKSKEKPSEATIKKFMQLGCMRIWSLKSHNNKKTNHENNQKSKA